MKWTTIDVGHKPFNDREHDHNNAVLQGLMDKSWWKATVSKKSAIEGKFSGLFVGGNDIGDGYFEWHTPLSVGIVSPYKGTLEVEIPPAKATFEVGYTSISTTIYHLNLERCLARWPYDSRLIYIFYCTDDWPCAFGNY